MSIAHERCFNHAGREAAARCPECGRLFCRECVSEHAGRVICATCLRDIAASTPAKRRAGIPPRILAVFLGILILWSSFFLLGKSLLSIPSAFHDITVWKEVVTHR